MEPRRPILARALAVGLSLALEATGPGAAGLVLFAAVARAQTPPAPQTVSAQPPAQAAQVMAFLDAQGLFKGQDDPLRTWMVKDGQITAMGRAAFDYFSVRPQEVKTFAPAFAKLRDSGPLSDQRARAIQRSLQDFNSQYGDIGAGGKSEDAFTLGARLNTILTGATEASAQQGGDPEPGSAGYVQIDRPDGLEFHDKEGLLIKTTKAHVTSAGDARVREILAKMGQTVPDGVEIDVQSALAILQAAGDISGPADPRTKKFFAEGGMQTFNRTIEAQQKLMNQNRPPNAPYVPVNGRYNYEMFQWSYWTMGQQVEETKLQYKVDRLARIAELLGKQFRDDQWYKDPKVERNLLDEARKKTFSKLWLLNRGPQFDKACGRKVENYLDLIDCKLQRRVAALHELEAVLGRYRSRVDGFKDANMITQEQFAGVQHGELLVRRSVTLCWIEGQRWRADAQMERLDFSAPDHALLKKAIDESPMSKEEKAAYEKRGQDILARIQRLKQVYSKLEDELNTAEAGTALGRIQGALAQTQKELGEAELDFTLYATMPGMAKSAKEESSGWINNSWKWASKQVNSASKKLWDGDAQGNYLRSRESLAGFSASFDNVTRLIAQGKFADARAALIASDPAAIQTHAKSLSLRAGEIGDSERIMAVLKKAGDSVTQVANQHFWVRMVGEFIIWSVATAIVAPAAGALLSGMSRAAFSGATALARGGRAARVGAFVLKAGGEIFEHSAIRLAALSPTASKVKSEYALLSRIGIRGAPIRIIDATAKRSLVAGSRIGAFAAMSGGISGAFTAGTHLYHGIGAGVDTVREQGLGSLFDGSAEKAVWKGGESAFASPVQAGVEGLKHGTKWAVDGWHPLLGLGFGLPSSIVEGKRFAGPLAENVASRGSVGLASKGLEAGLGRFGFKPATWLDRSMSAAVKGGGLKATFATTFGLADNISKYMLFSQGIGGVANFTSWQLNQADSENLERRIKRAAAAEQSAMMAPFWIMLPVFPARYEVQAAMQARQAQGYRELQKANELDIMANSAEGQTGYLRGRQDVPVIQRIFQWNPWAQEGNFGSYTITKDMKYDAIRETLPSEITGRAARDPKTGKLTLDPYSVNPLEYLKASLKENVPGKVTKIGRLALGDEVRDQAHALFEESIIRKPELAGKILDPKNLGRNVEGFGYVRPEHAEEVARVIYRHAKDLGIVGRATPEPATGLTGALRDRLHAATGDAEIVKLMPRVQERLKSYVTSEGEVTARAGVLLETLARTGKPSPGLKSMVDALVDRSSEWRVNWNKEGSPDFHKPWNELVQEFRNEGRWKAQTESLAPAEREIIVRTLDYFDAIHGRFSTFNKVDITFSRMQELLQARKSEAQGLGNRNLSRGVDRMLTELAAWKKAEPGGSAPVQDKGATLVADPAKPGKQTTSYNAMLARLRESLGKDATLAAGDKQQLAGLLQEMEAAPWLLHDSKGSALPGWRPEQFEALMTFMGGLDTGGARGAEVIRVFQMLKTGGGKTLLAYEGMLPIADASAGMQGKKVVFLTVLSNLEAQARIEFRAMRKLATDMQIDTWENFKTKIAQGKTRGRGGAEDYWIILDEMDGAALQPALTIGETTAQVSREHPAYRNLKGGLEKIERMLSGDARDLGQKLRFEGNRQKTVLDGVAEQDPHLATVLRDGAQKLLRLGEKVGKARGADLGQIRLEVERVLGEQQAILDATTQFGAGAGKFAEAQGRLSSLATELGQAKTTKALTTKLTEARARVAEQLAELSAPDVARSAQTKALRPALQAAQRDLEGMLAALGEKGPKGAKGAPTISERALAGAQRIRQLGAEEQAVLRAGIKRDVARLAEFTDAGVQMRTAAQDAGTGERVDAKAVTRQMNKLLEEQSNVLWRAKWKAGDASSSLQVERLTGEARAKRARAEALRAGNSSEASRLDGEVASLDAQVLALKSRSDGMRWLKDNAQEISAATKKGAPGWEGRVRELVERRQAVIDAALERENPIYTTFAQMKEKMYPLYASKLRTHNDGKMRIEAPERMEQGGARQRQEMVDRLETLAKRLEARNDPGAARARELLVKAQAELKGWRDGRQVRKALGSKEPAELKAAREAYDRASDELARMDVKTGETSVRVDQFFAEAKTLREQAAAKPKDAPALIQKAEAAEVQGKKALAELQTFQQEGGAKNTATRELLAQYMQHYDAFLKKNLPEVTRSFEQGAAENAQAWAAEVKAKGFDANALRARFKELNAQADRAATPAEASKLRSQAMEAHNDLAALEGVLAEITTRPNMWRTEGLRLRMDSDAALKAHFERIDGVGTTELAARVAMKYTGAQWLLSKLPGVKKLGIAQPITEGTYGLTRTYAEKLIREVAADPFLTPSQRWQLIWSIVPSALWPRGLHYHAAAVPGAGLLVQGADKVLGIQPSGETWVRRELFNLARGYTDNPATERFDNTTKKVNAVHNGQWFESMDTPTRRFWELEYGADLTLPYEHKAIVTMNDFVRDNRKVNIIGMSGTAGPEFRRYLNANDVRLSGDRLASTGSKDITFDVYSGPSGKYKAIAQAVKATKDLGGLTVLSLSDTRALKMAREYLMRSGFKEDQIAQVFSDTELLRVNNPAANVSKQTNLHGLNDGRVKVLLLDTRVAGRGLDLNFKGQRGSTDPKAFKGYNKMEMLIIDPQDMTEVHNIQAQGRIDLGRVNSGTERRFHLVMDVRTAAKDPVFIDMLQIEPRFARLKQDPAVRAIAAQNGRLEPEWVDIHQYIQGLEAQGAQRDVTLAYRGVVQDYLVKKQGEVELDQLRSSSVKQDKPAYNPLMRGLEGWAR